MKDETIHITALLRAALPHWRIGAIVCFVALLCGVGVMLLCPKEYKSTATMLIVGNKGDMASEMKMLKSSGLASLLGGSQSSVNIDDELAIITSTEVLGRTIRDLSLPIEYKTRLGLKKSELYRQSPVEVTFPNGFLDSIRREKRLIVRLEKGGHVSLKLSKGWFSSFVTPTLPLPARFTTPWGEIGVKRREGAVEPTDEIEVTAIPFSKTYEHYVKELKIKTVDPLSDVIKLELAAENSERSAELLATLMHNYNSYTIRSRREDSDITSRFIQQRLKEVSAELADYEYQIENYKKQNRLTDIATDVKVQLASSESYKAKEAELLVQRKLVSYVVEYLENPANDDNTIPIILTGDESQSPVSSEISAYNLLVNQRTKLKQVSGDKNPALLSVNEQLRQARNSLRESIRTLERGLELSVNELEKMNFDYKQWIAKLPTNEREFLEVKRMQMVKEALLVFLLQKMEESEMTNNPHLIAGRVIDQPFHSFRHTFPKGSIVLPVACVTGLLVSMLLICIGSMFKHCKEEK